MRLWIVDWDFWTQPTETIRCKRVQLCLKLSSGKQCNLLPNTLNFLTAKLQVVDVGDIKAKRLTNDNTPMLESEWSEPDLELERIATLT